MTTIAVRDGVNLIDRSVAILARKELVYILGEDPGGLIAKTFSAHPGYAFVVEWFISECGRVVWLSLLDNGQLYDSNYILEQTALFDTYEQARVAAEEFDRKAGVGTTIPLKFEVGSLPPPKGGSRSWRSQ